MRTSLHFEIGHDLESAFNRSQFPTSGRKKTIMKRFRHCCVLLALASPLWIISAAHADCSSPANAIVAENCLPGTPQNQWDISGAGDSTIQGFTTDISVNRGQTVSFKISTNATNYRLSIYRLGYYGGMGARLVATVSPSAQLPQTQPACITDTATALMDCGNWAVSATWGVPSTAVSGIYIAKVTRLDTNGSSHIPFVVRDDLGNSPILFKTSDTTWQAYNDYGGANLYTGGPGPQNGAYKVSYNRPYHTRVYEFYSWIFNAEYPMVRFIEANGYDVSYFSSLDADRFGSRILQHKVLLSVGHDEYWSGSERSNVEAARAAGVNLGFFSGNEVFWKIRWEPSVDGSNTANRTMVCFKETHANRVTDPQDPPIWTGTWRDPRFSPPGDGGRPENALTGTIFMVNGPQSPPLSIKVPAADGKMRLWRNTPVATQAAGATATFPAGTLGYEWDVDLDNGFRPAGLFYLSTATYDTGGNSLLDFGSSYGSGTATHHLTMYRDPSGALVFGSGTVQWPWGLDASHDGSTTTPNASMQQATINLFADMGIQPANLQAGLAAASKSTDTIPPASTITSPPSGGTAQSGTSVTITGTATDTAGVVGAVEVSTDGGTSWHPATGRGSWTYNWTPSGTGSVLIQSRAVDDSGNIETPSGGVTITLAERSCPCSIWNNPTPSTPDGKDSAAVELGLKFRPDVNGFITGISFYKSAANTGTHVGHLWSSSGALLATGTFSGESSSGWQKLTFANPVTVTANTTYVASYFAPNGHYAADENYFASSGVDNAPLHALADGVDGANGTYVYGTGNSFPGNSYRSTNYWVDVVFATSTGADTTPPYVSSVNPPTGATLVPTDASVNAVFSEQVLASTVSGSTVQLFGPSNSLVPATVTYSPGSQSAILTPNAPLAFSTTYTAVVSGGSGGIKDTAGNAMTSNFTWSFTTTAAPSPPGTCPCSVWSLAATPGLLDSGDTAAVELGFRFRSDLSGSITSLRFYKSTANIGPHSAHLWTNTGTLLATATFSGEGTSGWQQVDFSTPVPITANATYVASYFAPNGHYSADSNFFATGVDNPPLHALQNGADGADGVYHYGAASAFPASTFQSSNYWVDVVFVPTANTTPPTVTSVAPVNGSSSVSPSTTPVVIFSQPMNASTINGTTFLLADASGSTVPSTVSYNPSALSATLAPNAVLAPSTTYVATVRGGSNGVKDSNGNALALDYSWSFSTAGDTTPPSVTTVSPAAGATGVSTTTAVNVVFSEAINSATVNGNSVQLYGPGNSLIAATVTYASSSQTATLQPTASLAPFTAYTLMVVGGSSGVKDLASNAMTSTFTSSFTTAAVGLPPGNCPCTIWTPSTTPGLIDAGDSGSIEIGVRFRSDVSGWITGVQFYKSISNTGTHSAHLWTNTGALLASATFSDETNSGWQQVNFSSPVAISAGTTYVASYFAPSGHYAANNSYFSSTVDNPPLHALQDGSDGGDGVYNYGTSSSFPTSSYLASNYWVDVTFVPSGSTTPPSVASVNPANGASGANIGGPVTVIFNEPMDAQTINGVTIFLTDPSHTSVPGTVTYNAANSKAVFTPTATLNALTTYTATVKGGSGGVKDFSGNTMTSDFVWSFTTASGPPMTGPGGPILVISSLQNPFSRYYSEILNAEGLNEYSVTDISGVTSSLLSNYDVVILGDMSLSSSQVSMLSSWVNGGGSLIAMHPDKQLASLLGLSTTASTLTNSYVQVRNTVGPGVGIIGQTIQFHGTADLYALNGATAVATLYSGPSTPTASPAVTVVNAGAGQAAAFTYDLARSVIYTRQGNPAWSGQARDGQAGPIRSDDLYFGAATFDRQPDWVDFNKIQIPQADEQQRLLVNLILQMNSPRKPLPRFWYFPSALKAVVIMTGDDHANGGTSGRFDTYLADSPAGCSVADWQCVRGTSYVYTNTPIPNYQNYVAQGFEIALHLSPDPYCDNWTRSSLDSDFASQLSEFSTAFPGLPAPRTNRTHCVSWSDYDSQPIDELNHGIRLDTDYYYWPAAWVQDRPGLFTGSGMPMRFADRNGNTIDVYQAVSQMTDESGQSFPLHIDTLLDNALGSQGFYGAFTANMHTDFNPSDGQAGSDAIVASAKARGVPVVSALQMLTWLDGRNASSFGSLSWSGSTLSFTISAVTGARNLRAMIPTISKAGALATLTLNGNPVSFTSQTIKGVTYAFFVASNGSYQASYTGGTPAPVASLSPTSLTYGNQTINTTSAAQVVTLSNTGTATMTISAYTFTGTNASDFAQTHTCGTTLAAGANCTISVTFRPAATGSRSASLSISDNAAGSPQVVTLTGTGIAAAPVASLSPTSLTFGNQTVNTTSAARTVTLSNTGTATMTISTYTFTGTNASDFAQTHTCGTTLAAGANCTISVTFRPAATGSRSANLSISDNAAGSPQVVTLTGTGIAAAPVASLSPTSLTFGNQTVNTTSAAKVVTLSNTGTATMTISAYTFTGTNASDFAQTHTCGTTLATGANCTISVTFRPAATGSRSASLSISDNAAGSPQVVTLTGTGIAAAPVASLSPTSLTFGNQTVNTTSAARTVTLSNTGTATMTISTYTFTGTNASDFAQTHTCGTTLAAGANCTISVTFRPAATGSRSANLSISDNAAGSPQVVTLTGTGIAAVPAASLSPTSLSFGLQRVNTSSAPKTVTLSNTGTASLTISGYTFTGSNPTSFSQTHTCGSTLAAGASCTISVTFRPTAGGIPTATLNISDNAAGSPQQVSLLGLAF